MKVSLGTLEVSRETREAISAYLGTNRLASEEEIRIAIWAWFNAALDDVEDEHRRKKPPREEE